MITEYTLCEWRLIEINERIHAYLLALSSANSSKRDWLLRSNSLFTLLKTLVIESQFNSGREAYRRHCNTVIVSWQRKVKDIFGRRKEGVKDDIRTS